MEMEARSPDSDLQIDKLIAELVALDDPKSSEKYTVLSREIKGRRSLNLEGALKEYNGTAKSKALAIILEMVDCSSLLSLSLDRNGLRPADMTTLTSVSKFPELQTLRLDDNDLGDVGVKVLAMSLGEGWVPSLLELRISRCRVGSAGLTDLGNAFGTGSVSRSLKVLDLGGNKYTSAPDGHGALTEAMSSGYLPALEELRLQDCRLGSIGWEQYARAISTGQLKGQPAVPVLKIIDFSSNWGLHYDKAQFLAKAFSRGKAYALREINFSYNDIGDLDLRLDASVHSSVTQLRKLLLRGTGLTENGFLSIAELVTYGFLKSLEVLDVSDNSSIQGVRELCTSLESGKATHLRELLLGNIALGNQGLMAIARAVGSGHLKSLEVLDISNYGLFTERADDQGLPALANSSKSGHLSHLRELDLSGTATEDAGFLAVARAFEFGHLKSLQVLKILNTRITASCFCKLKRAIFWQLNKQLTLLGGPRSRVDPDIMELESSRLRKDVYDMGFKLEEAYSPLLVLCLYDVVVSSEIVQIIFFHVEGMASLLGIGLPFSRVSIGSQRKIVVEEMSEDDYVSLWMYQSNSFKPMVFERVVENPSAISSGTLDLSTPEALSRFGVGVDGRNHFIGQNAKIQSESNNVNFGISWLTESWFNQVFEKRRLENEEEEKLRLENEKEKKVRLEKEEEEKLSLEKEEEEAKRRLQKKSEAKRRLLQIAFEKEEEEEEEKQGLALKIDLAEEEEEKHRLAWKARIARRTVGTDPFQSTMQSMLDDDDDDEEEEEEEEADEEEEEEEEKQRLAMEIKFAEQEEEFERPRLRRKGFFIGSRTVGTDPFQPTMQSPLESQPAIEERVGERMVTVEPAIEERVTAERMATTEPAAEERVAERMAITERKSTTSAHGERLAAEKQDHKGKQLVGAHEGGVAPKKQENKEKELGSAHEAGIQLGKQENQEQVDVLDADSRSTTTGGGSSRFQWLSTIKESVGDVFARPAEKLETPSTSQDARFAEAPEEKVSNLTDDKMLTIVVEMGYEGCQLYDHLSQGVIDSNRVKSDHVLRDCLIKPKMTIEFIGSPIGRVGNSSMGSSPSSGPIVRIDDGPTSHRVNVRFEVAYQITANVLNSEKFGWYQDNLCLSFECENDSKVNISTEGEVNGLKYSDVKDSTTLGSSQSHSKMSNQNYRARAGPKNIGQVEVEGGTRREAVQGSTNSQLQEAQYGTACLEKASAFAILSRFVRNKMAYEAVLRNDIAALQDYNRWDDTQRGIAAVIAGMFSTVSIDVKEGWHLLGDENQVHVFSAEKKVRQDTKNVEEVKVPKKFLQRLKFWSSRPKVSTTRISHEILEQKISRKFLLNHSFSHLNNIEAVKKDKPYVWYLLNRIESPIEELISLHVSPQVPTSPPI